MPGNAILIIDDEPTNLAALQQILESEYRLVFARSGTDGLLAAKKHNPILILLDIQMHDMDGYAVCRALKADPLTENTPVIFVSALSEVGHEAAGFECGAVDYIIKPVSPALVRARVRNQLSLVRASTLERYISQLEVEQAKTARLSRIHAVLSGTNSAIVRIREPQALFEEACRIAVVQGGFGVAWIGLVNDKAGLNLAASVGVDVNQLAELLPSLATTEVKAIGIPTQVVNSGKTSLCNDVLTLANYHDPTCLDAKARGYLSVIGLPLFTLEAMAGVIVLYAREADYFDDQELKLLNELAGDISFALQAMEHEKRASFLSYYDSLTRLPNTALFLERSNQLIQSTQEGIAFIIVLNLDRFKQLNDALGRPIGDQVLRIVAQRLSEGLSPSLEVARIGADNFALAGALANNEDISDLCNHIVSLLEQPFSIEGTSLHLSARLGIATYPTDADNIESLFKNAETALKQTKSANVRFLFYSREMDSRIAEKVLLENMLTIALEEAQFILHYQPKVDLTTGRIVGAEALIRWQHPQRGLVQPVDFIPLSEETGLIVKIGDWVLRTVCAQQSAWAKAGVHIVPVALNLSALQFHDGNFLQTLKEILPAHQLDPKWLDLELTETLIMHNPAEAEALMRAFRKLGLRLSLDDFGTGYSSLAYLKRFPFDTLKIDRAFVTDITRNPEDAAIASATIAMAHNLRMHVVAEGVETEAQLNFLRTKHCDQIQGYFFSRPVSASDFESMLRLNKCLELPSRADGESQILLIMDEEETPEFTLKHRLNGEGYRILTASSIHTALEILASNAIQVILCKQQIGTVSGTGFLAMAAKLHPTTMRVLLADYRDLQPALDAVNRGEIYRLLTEPLEDELLRQNVRDAFRRHRLPN